MNVLVPPKTDVIIVGETKEWCGANFQLHTTTKMNTFEPADIIINPETGECRHHAPQAQAFGKSYAATGYYGFLKDGFCMIVPGEHVFVDQEVLEEVAA